MTTSEVEPTTVVQGGPAISSRNVAAASWALFCGLALIMVGNGLNGAVLGIRSEAEGFGLAVSGLVMASFFAGFLAGTSFAEYALRTVGHIRVFAALASTASSAVLIHTVVVDPFVWAVLRFIFGACMAGLYVVVESWLNDLATNATRARILAIYMVVSMGVTRGRAIAVEHRRSVGLHTLRRGIGARVHVTGAGHPVGLQRPAVGGARTDEPAVVDPRRAIGRVLVVLRRRRFGDAVGAWAPCTARLVGMSAARISLFLAAPMVASVVSQWPIGLLADRFPRRAVMIVVATVAASASASLLVIPAGSDTAIVAMFVVGAAAYPLYSLTLAYSNDWLPPEQIMGASAALVRINGIGALVGPLVTAVLMAAIDPEHVLRGDVHGKRPHRGLPRVPGHGS